MLWRCSYNLMDQVVSIKCVHEVFQVAFDSVASIIVVELKLLVVVPECIPLHSFAVLECPYHFFHRFQS